MNNTKLTKVITIVVLIIVIIAIILLLRGKGDTAKLQLVGSNEMVIYQNDQFKDPGYLIIETNNTSGFYVNIEGEVNNNKIGIYFIKYYLYNKQGNLVSDAERQVIVTEDKLTNITMYLNGEEEEFYFVDNYVEQGALAYQNSNDITDKIVIDTNLDASIPGKYLVNYQVILNNKVKEITRTVNIIDLNVTEDIDYQKLEINLLIDCDNYYYTLLPNGLKEYSKDVSYSFDNVGEYTFDVYLKNNSHKEYTVKITSIDDSGPIGTCSLYHDNNQTTISMNVNDASGIAKYVYNGLEFHGNKTVINKITPIVTVRVYDNRGNYTDIKCKSEYGTGFRTISVDSRGNVQNKKGYVVCNTSTSNASKELDELMQSYGYKTRGAVAAAGVYLATYEYNIPYFWGGKSTSKGFDTFWGCRKSHRTDHDCSRPLASDNSYCEYGLDCAGFTRWAYIQAGFDVSILREDKQTESNWGNFNPRTHKYTFTSSNQQYINQIKPGDIIHREGHVGLIIGVTDTKLQVAEMAGPILVTTYNKSTGDSLSGRKKFTDFVLMEDFFKMYGN